MTPLERPSVAPPPLLREREVGPGELLLLADVARLSRHPADAVAGSVRAVLGDTPLVSWLVTEMTLLFYALLGWSREFRPRAGQQSFSYHRRNHYGTLLAVLLCLLPIETAVVHVAVALVSPLAAWIVTGLSLYGALWLLGDYQGCRLHPIVLQEGVLHLPSHVAAEWPAGTLVRIEPMDYDRLVLSRPDGEGEG